MLEVEDLRVRRGSRWVLRDVSWRVARGEPWAILGPNGSGKTTLLAALAGYVSPTGGVIRVLGREFGRYDWRDLRREIGIVSGALARRMSPEETALGCVASGRAAVVGSVAPPRGRARAEATRILRSVGCARLAERPWEALSEGERQRVQIGRALMARFRLLLLDEPCAGLDPLARSRFLAFLDRLARRGDAPGIVLVTHHLEEIVPAIRRVLLLGRGGRIVAQGPRRAVLTSENLRRAGLSL